MVDADANAIASRGLRGADRESDRLAFRRRRRQHQLTIGGVDLEAFGEDVDAQVRAILFVEPLQARLVERLRVLHP